MMSSSTSSDPLLYHLLIAVGSPPAGVSLDDASRRASESELSRLLGPPSCGGALLALVRGSSHVGVRQLAGVLLRKKLVSYWGRLPPVEQAAVQAALIAALSVEPERLVRKALVAAIASLARVTLPGGGWPELLGVLVGCPASPQAAVRELGLLLLRELAESLRGRLVEHAAALRPVWAAGLADSELAVRLAAMRGLALFLTHLEDERPSAAKSFAALVPPLLQATAAALAGGEEGAAEGALEALSELIESDARVLRSYTGALAAFLCGVLGAGALGAPARACAGGALVELVSRRPKAFAAGGFFASSLLPAALAALLEFDPEEDAAAEREAYEAGVEGLDAPEAAGSQPWNVAAHCIDCAACALPPRVVYPALSAAVAGLIREVSWEGARQAGRNVSPCAARPRPGAPHPPPHPPHPTHPRRTGVGAARASRFWPRAWRAAQTPSWAPRAAWRACCAC